MAALSTGHMAVDFAGGVLPALLPFIAEEYDLSYAYVGLLILASALASSIVQPLFGFSSDRRGAIWLLPAGVAVGGIGMALAALSPTYWWIVLFVIVSGLGTAAYHPEGSKFAAYASGTRRASGMSLFSIGGNLGYSLGVIVTTPIVVLLGVKGAAFVVLPCLAVAAMLLWLVPFLLAFVPPKRAPGTPGEGDDRLGAMAILLGVVTVRSIAWFGLITFVPLWEVSLGNSKGYGNTLLSVMLLAGAAGTLLAGPAADRFGRRPVILVSNLVIPPAIAVFIVVGGLPGAISLIVIGAAVVGTLSVTMVMSQEYMPRHIRRGLRAVDRVVDWAGRHRRGHSRCSRRLDRPRDSAVGLCGCAPGRRRAHAALAADDIAPAACSNTSPPATTYCCGCCSPARGRPGTCRSARREDRAEHLVTVDLHLGGDVVQDGRAHPVPACSPSVDDPAVGDDLGAGLLRAVDVAEHPLLLLGGDGLRAPVGSAGAVADLASPCACRRCGRRGRRRSARRRRRPRSPCTARPPSRSRRTPRVGGHVEVGVGQHDHVVLGAAEGLHPLPFAAAALVDVLRDRRRADEADRGDIRGGRAAR